jgi:hypothetical protein
VRKIGRWLRGFSVIELEHAAEPFTAPYWARSEWCALRRDELVAQTLVRSFLVIMIHERADGSPEVFLAERHDSVEALGLEIREATLPATASTGSVA